MEKRILLPGCPDFSTYWPSSICMVTAVDAQGKVDICTVGAWSAVNGSPQMFGIAMCARSSGNLFWKRYTTTCIEQTGEFVINIPHAGLKKAWSICGEVSLTQQPEADKFALAGLTAAPANMVKAPLIAECPFNIECRVYAKLELPTHDWIVGQPLACHRAADIVEGRAKLVWENTVRLQ